MTKVDVIIPFCNTFCNIMLFITVYHFVFLFSVYVNKVIQKRIHELIVLYQGLFLPISSS